jgi:hypothetical protein
MSRRWLFLALWLACPLAARAADPPEVKHRILLAEYSEEKNRLLEISPEGKVTWEHKVPGIAVIFQPLPGGNVLYAYGGENNSGVREVNRDGKVVWDYKSDSKLALGCERLKDGNTLVAEQGPCQVVEVDRKGKVVRTVPLTTSEMNILSQVRNVHRLANGNFLAAHEGEGAVREVSPAGKIVWGYAGVADVFDAQRLPNGNTLIACGTQERIIEVTPAGKVVWELKSADIPEVNLAWAGSIQVLKNGNLVISNFLQTKEGSGAHAFEVTRDKKVVWKFADHKLVKSVATVRVLED